MGEEIDLLVNYPRTRRNVDERGQTKTEEDRRIARQFGREFFDGERKRGYGGFSYNSRFWQPVVPAFQDRYGLTAASSLLDVGCAKGFMLHDFALLIPGITVKGIDVSAYAIKNAIGDMKPHVQLADDFDAVIEQDAEARTDHLDQRPDGDNAIGGNVKYRAGLAIKRDPIGRLGNVARVDKGAF